MANLSNKKKQVETNGTHKKNQSHSLPSLWTRFVTPCSSWPDKDEFLDIIYWSRQILGLFLGIIWGILPFKGFLAIALSCQSTINLDNRKFYCVFMFAAMFCGVNAGLVYIYTSVFQRVDDEEFGGAWELVKEGFMTSFAGFLVTWIIIYSAIHYD